MNGGAGSAKPTVRNRAAARRLSGDRGGLAWLALGLVLSTATQLRSESAPLGPGEVILALWVAWRAIAPTKRRSSYRDLLRLTAAFWFAALMLNVIGAAASDILQVSDYTYFLREMAALVLAGATTVAWISDATEESTKKLAANLVTIGAALVTAVLLFALFVSPSFGGVQFWYSVRFRGLSSNPNQLALLLSGMPFLALHVARAARSRRAKLWYISAALASVGVGVMTRSDALTVAWLSGAAILTALGWVRSVRKAQTAAMTKGVLVVLLPLVLLSIGIGFGQALVARADQSLEAMYDDGGQGVGRLTLWQNGLGAMKLSPAVGLGPGPKSGFTGPLQGAEAHNTFVDWGASTGVLGLIAFSWYLGALLLRAYRGGSALLLSLEGTMIVFAVFHYVVRHPVYWSYALLAACAGQAMLRKSYSAIGGDRWARTTGS